MFNAELSPRRYRLGPRSQQVWGLGWVVGWEEITISNALSLSPPLTMGSDGSQFNVSIIVRGKVTIKTVFANHNF